MKTLEKCTCKVDGCGGKTTAQGLCNKHYKRLRINGGAHVLKQAEKGTFAGYDKHLIDTWRGMLRRCTNEKHRDYKYYGARGITVCDRWLTFKNFAEDMGARPDGFTLERVDNDAGYSLANCKWASRQEQAQNRTQNSVTLEIAKSVKKMLSAGFGRTFVAGVLFLPRQCVERIDRGYSWSNA